MGGDYQKKNQAADDPRHSPVFARSLLHVLRNTGISLIYQDCDLRLEWAQHLPRAWQAVALNGATDTDFLPADQAQLLIDAKKAALATLKPQRLEIISTGEDGQQCFDVWVDADLSPDGKAVGVITTLAETTDQKRREQTLKVLLREVSHRSKNLLAIIQSIASQTGRYSGTIETFLARFRGRIQSLASSQDLVTSSNWRGADLQELVTGQVGKYASDPARSIKFEGVRPYLTPNAALHVGLALHELAVNSVSYGALSRPGGIVTVSAAFSPEDDGRSLILHWSERIFGLGSEKLEKRFGSVALERVVPASLGTTAELTMDSDRLTYSLTIPADSFDLD